MKQNVKLFPRLMAVFLLVVILIGMLPLGAFAADAEDLPGDTADPKTVPEKSEAPMEVTEIFSVCISAIFFWEMLLWFVFSCCFIIFYDNWYNNDHKGPGQFHLKNAIIHGCLIGVLIVLLIFV